MHAVLERTVMETLSRLNQTLETLLDKALCVTLVIF
jgi:hypothetical protein